MFRRILRSAIVLAVLIVAYEAYVTFAVPQMEPQLTMKEQRRPTEADLGGARESATKYQRLMSNYFPADHWSQQRPPKVITNADEKAMLVFDDFTRHVLDETKGDGSKGTQVDIERITFLMFPTPPREGLPAPSDAIILEAPQGAHFVFDEFSPEIGKIGKILRGDFPGLIRIHSDMKDPSPEDDLLIETADVQMNTKLMFTSAPVKFRMGKNFGGGNELEIRFLTDDHSKPDDPGLKIDGIDSLEIRRDVRMRLELDTSSLMSSKKDVAATANAKAAAAVAASPAVQVTDPSAAKLAAEKPEKPPVDVACSGPFTFDFVRYVASLDRDVTLVQTNPDGPSDQMTCMRLDLHFLPKQLPNGASQPIVIEAGKRQQRDLSQLEPSAIVAEGHPVVMSSPARKAQARGDRIQIALRDQRVRISGGSDSMLVFGTNVLRAPVIDYQQPARDSGTSLGSFQASGPGTLQYVADPTKPQQVLNAEWQKSVLLVREKGQPVLFLGGRPKIAFGPSGSITADEIRLYLRELEGEGSEGMVIGGSGGDGKTKIRLAPDRLLATGQVEVVSPQLTARTQQLSAAFRIEVPAANIAAAGGAGAAVAAPAAAASGKPEKVAAGGLFAGAFGAAAPTAGQPQQSYSVDADQIRLDMLVKGQTAVPTGLGCVGHIVLREMSQVATGQQPLEIRGGQLTVDHLDTTPRVTLRGEDPMETTGKTGSAPGAPQLAQLAGRGVTVLTDVVELDYKENRLWSNGPGTARLQMTRGLTGNAAAANQPVPMDLQWQGKLQFDGRTISFERDVVVSGMDGTLHCNQLSATLLTPIQFGQKFDQSNADLSEIECRGQVMIENVTRDAGGVASHDRVELDWLAINQKTGNITGGGPGVIRSTRYGNQLVAIPGQPQTTAGPQASAAGSKLNFIRVDFQGGLTGNMYLKDLTLHNRVRTVYGPVDSWEQELDLTRPETLSPETIKLTCDDLRLNEDAVAARAMAAQPDGSKRQIGPIQMAAKGDVRIDGQVPAQGEFSVQADVATYEEVKQVFMLEGNTRSNAKLWRRTAGGGTSPPTEARRIWYNQRTGDIKVDGMQFIEITPQDLQNAQRPKGAPK